MLVLFLLFDGGSQSRKPVTPSIIVVVTSLHCLHKDYLAFILVILANCKQMDLKLPNFTPFYNPWNSKVEKTQLDDIISKSPGKQKV